MVMETAHEYGVGFMASEFGIAAPAPIVEGATYEQVGEHDYYFDQTVLGWFREINHIT